MTATVVPPTPSEQNRQQLRDLLTGYSVVLDRVETDVRSGPLGLWRPLVRRCLTARIRRSIDELDRTLHDAQATGRALPGGDGLLTDLEHFDKALRAPLTSFQRTLVVVAVILVAQLLSRARLIPIVKGPQHSPITGSLQDALDVNPGHIAKTITELVTSPLPTTLGALFTLAAATFVVLGVPALAFRRARLMFGGPCYRSRRMATCAGGSLPAQEREVFVAVGAREQPPQTHDLLIASSLVAASVTLGLAWYVAFVDGLLRPTSRFDDTNLAFREAFVSTRHPPMLGNGGILFILAGIAIGFVLLYVHPRSGLRQLLSRPLLHAPDDARARRRGPSWWRRVSVPACVVAAIVLAALVIPLSRSYHEPHIVVRLANPLDDELGRQPVIAFGMACQPSPCSVTEASIQLAGPGTLAAPTKTTSLAVQIRKPLPSLRKVPISVPAEARRTPVGWRALPWDRYGPRFVVKRTQLVSVEAVDPRALTAIRLSASSGRGHHVPGEVRAPDYAAAALVDRGRRRVPAVFSAYNLTTAEVPGYGFLGIVLSRKDVARVRAQRHERGGVLGTVTLTIRMHNGTTRPVKLPLVLRGSGSSGGF